ncbi:MAG: chemotaxis protein CheC [Candidatus Omnitrophica bacterium]|nr:chemotaxis protein CheC [Candidatus Omnitrophota bacterium]MBU1851666.1 chemotaxis protein CheC [Candidatus Omnitrophota bacterium]
MGNVEKKQIKLEKMINESARAASDALSKLSDNQVTIKVSSAEITNVKRTWPGIGPETIVGGIYMPISGEVAGAALIVIPENVAYALSDMLVKRPVGSTKKLTELDISALKEVGNIICGNFMTIFSNTLKVKIVENLPQFTFDMFGAVVEQIIAQFAERSERALIIEVRFSFGETSTPGNIILIFGIEEIDEFTKELDTD